MLRLLASLCHRVGDQLRKVLYTDLKKFSGPRLKVYEDQLDATFCALLAYLVWARGTSGFEVVGDMDTVVHRHPDARTLCNASHWGQPQR